MAKKISKEAKALMEAGREAMRLVVITSVPLMIDGLNKGYIDWRGIALAVSIVLLRSVEKYFYEAGKDGNLNPVSKLLTFE